MKQFSDFVKYITDYFEHQQNAAKNTVGSKWFSEFFPEEDPDSAEVLAKYNDGVDCATRSATKEMLDTIAEISRARTIRNKKRVDFFCDSIIRHEGTLHRLGHKKDRLSDRIT